MPQKIIAAGGLVTNENNHLLMIFRRGKWDLPKGKLDDGETIEDCALREVQEETGLLKVQRNSLVGITYHEYFDKHINGDVLKETYWYHMTAGTASPLVPQQDEGIEKLLWADQEMVYAMLANTYPNIIDIIQKFRKIYPW